MKIREFTNKTVRHSDPLPKVSKPVTGREQKHPYTGMLVGSKYDVDEMYDEPVKQITKSIDKYEKMKMLVKYALDLGFNNLNELQKPGNLDKVIARMRQDGIDVTEGNLGNIAGAGATVALIGLLGFGNMSSMKDSPLGKELSVAAQQGDMVAAYHLKNLDLYADQDMMRTIQNLKIAYIDDANRQDVDALLSDPKRFPGIKPRNESTTFESLDESVGEFITEEEFDQLAEKQDACYHKVKSRYKVWPSAYASGALVKCRKVGAKNWGNSSKKKKSKKK